jgi:DNA modification methylase
MKVLQGDSKAVLQGLDRESVDVVYMCPSPFGYYPNNPEKIGGQKSIGDYVISIISICNHCKPVLKKSGSLFVQVPDVFTPFGNLASIPTYFEMEMVVSSGWTLNDRLVWHRTENHRKQPKPEQGFIKNFEHIFHFIVDEDQFYFNENSPYAKTSVFSYPLEDSYYTNEFDSGLPEQLFRMVIDTTCPPNGVTLDPLCGSAKLGIVAKKMNRDFIGIDIDPEIVRLCNIRLGLS